MRTCVPEEFFREEFSAPFTYVDTEADCGCIQTDSITVDIEGTLRAYRSLAQANAALLPREVEWCRREGVDCIVSDTVPFAFDVAAAADLPSCAVANFTWHNIYEPYVANAPWFGPFLQQIAQQYRRADLLLEAYPAMPMPLFRRRVPVPLIGRKGRNVRQELTAALGLDPRKHLGLI